MSSFTSLFSFSISSISGKNILTSYFFYQQIIFWEECFKWISKVQAFLKQPHTIFNYSFHSTLFKSLKINVTASYTCSVYMNDLNWWNESERVYFRVHWKHCREKSIYISSVFYDYKAYAYGFIACAKCCVTRQMHT